MAKLASHPAGLVGWLFSLCLLPLADTAVLAAQPANRVGGEFQVNVYTTGDQRGPRVARAAGGDFVVTWHSFGEDGHERGVFARRFDSAGAPQAGEFQVNTYTAGGQDFPAVAISTPLATSSSLGRAKARTATREASTPAASIRPASPRRAEFRSTPTPPSDQRDPAVALAAAGDFVVAWGSDGQDGDAYGIFARRFDAAGIAQAAELRVNTVTTGHQARPRSAATPMATSSSPGRATARTATASASLPGGSARPAWPRPSSFQVNAYTTNSQIRPSWRSRRWRLRRHLDQLVRTATPRRLRGASTPPAWP